MKCPGWSKDVCMCGMDVDHDPWWEGHAPVSQWDYYECTEESDEPDEPKAKEQKK